MTRKTKMSLLGAALMALITTGCGIVFDATPRHIFGAVLFVATLSFTMDMFPKSPE